ncbi:MAG: bifunctional folylpolyglutamate synthase/dihydrofolate synthase [Anaerolineales bacterium]|nr:bifunctional folylpolyglutamate synthase/dihydrofolate synthase [Anaerolineales bacterium]
MTLDTYKQALDYLYSYADYSVERSYRYSPELFELQRVRDLLARLGDPQEQYKSFHIAGTKGKGSVSALISSALRAAGYSVGLYTSPHLHRFNERMQVNGEEISDDGFVDLINRVRPALESIDGLTVYEIATAAGLLHFADRGVEYAAIEVGLGGRLDATNVITPLVAVITTLSYDHMHLLGDSLSDIAREKAGIIKEGVPVVLAPQQYEAVRVIERIAEERKAPLVRVGEDWLFSTGSHSLERQTLYIWPSEEQPLMDAYVETAGGEEWAPPRYEIPLLGYHQVINAAVAYAALQSGKTNGILLSEEHIKQGFKQVDWPGRFQIISRRPLLIVDSAHNRDSALKLRLALEDYFPGQPVTMIFGASADKDIAGMLAELLPRVSRIVVTQADHPRAEEPELIAELAHSHGFRVQVIRSMDEALSWAIKQARPGEVILAAGSLFIAAEAIEAWDRIGVDVISGSKVGA